MGRHTFKRKVKKFKGPKEVEKKTNHELLVRNNKEEGERAITK